MELNDYQRLAARTRIQPAREAPSTMVAMLGLAGETGQLLSEYKKWIRDGDAHLLHRQRVAEELGDLLWYVSEVAGQFQLSLEEIAIGNLAKTEARFGGSPSAHTVPLGPAAFDRDFAPHQQLPRAGWAEIRPVGVSAERRIETLVNGKKMGQDLTDNAWTEDGYRLHDVFHLACMTLLGWSPVIRRGLLCKRKQVNVPKPDVDEVEDGGRAVVIEEGVSALIFSYAIRHQMLEGVRALDYPLLRTVKQMTEHLEVRVRTEAEWQNAILKGYDVWRAVAKDGSGRINFDAEKGMFKFERLAEPPVSARPKPGMPT